MKRTIAFFILQLFFVSQLVAQERDLLDGIKENFVKHATIDIDDYEVCEIVEKKTDKKIFLQKSFGKAYRPGHEIVANKEIFIRQVNEKQHLHLGVVSLVFPDKKNATAMFDAIRGKDGTGFLGGTKILTQYKALKTDNTVIVVYSETFSDPKLKQFMATLSAN